MISQHGEEMVNSFVVSLTTASWCYSLGINHQKLCTTVSEMVENGLVIFH